MVISPGDRAGARRPRSGASWPPLAHDVQGAVTQLPEKLPGAVMHPPVPQAGFP
jgi:hypothetical protein